MNIRQFIVCAVMIGFVILVIHVKNDSLRIQYENFLLSQYNIIPTHTEEELKNIPKPEHPHMAIFQNFFMSLDPAL